MNNYSYGNYSFTAGFQNQTGIENTINGMYSFALGYQCWARGNNSIALGTMSFADEFSFAFGQSAKANATQSFAIGRFVETNASGAFAIGSSELYNEMVNNEPNSLMIGFNSSFPTLFVGETPYGQEFGKVGIGTTEPQTDLHVNGSFLTKEFYYPTANAQSGYVLTYNGKS